MRHFPGDKLGSNVDVVAKETRKKKTLSTAQFLVGSATIDGLKILKRECPKQFLVEPSSHYTWSA